MQQLQSHYTWFCSYHRLRISAFLAMALLCFALANAAIFILTQTSQNVQAQTVPNVVETSKSAEKVAVVEVDPAVAATNTETATTQQTTRPVSTPTITPAPAPAQPRAAIPAPSYDKVSIPGIGLTSRFVTVGLTNTNAIDVHPSLVGWWNGSAQLGSPGAVFLDGHNPGVFSRVPLMKEGVQISLTKASGETFNYTVVHVETVMLVGINMRAALTPYGGAREGLNLMTCVGAYNAQTGTTDQRLVVYAIRS